MLKLADFVKHCDHPMFPERQMCNTSNEALNRLNEIKNLWLFQFTRWQLSSRLKNNLHKDEVRFDYREQLTSAKVNESEFQALCNMGCLSLETYMSWVLVRPNMPKIKQQFRFEQGKDEPVKEIIFTRNWLYIVWIKQTDYTDYVNYNIPPLHVIQSYEVANAMNLFDEIVVLEPTVTQVKVPLIDDPILCWVHKLVPEFYFVINAWYENITGSDFVTIDNKVLYQKGIEETRELALGENCYWS